MKFIYNVQLEPTDIALAISAYLKTNGVDAEVSVAQLEDFGDDFSLSIQTGGAAPTAQVGTKPVKRKRRSAAQKAAEEEAAKAADSEEVESDEEETEITTKQQAVVIEDDAPTTDAKPDLMQQALDEADAKEAAELKASIKAESDTDETQETEEATTDTTDTAQEGAPVPLAKKSIFKRKK